MYMRCVRVCRGLLLMEYMAFSESSIFNQNVSPIICPDRLSTAWLVSVFVVSCRMVSKWRHVRSISNLWGDWCALHRTTYFFSHCWLCPGLLYLLSVPDVCPCLCMRCWAYFFHCYPCGRKLVLCSLGECRYIFLIIACSTQELYTCLFRQMTRLLLMRSWCLACAAQHAKILRCISLTWFFSSTL